MRATSLTSRRRPRGVPMRAVMIGDHPLVIIAPPDHELVSKRAISKDRIAREHFLVREPGSGTRTSLEIYLADIRGQLDNLGSASPSSRRTRLSKRLSLAALSYLMSLGCQFTDNGSRSADQTASFRTRSPHFRIF
jgi:DNA-binding transcriptional LysR family regulator